MSVLQAIEEIIDSYDASAFIRGTDYEANIKLHNQNIEGETLFVYNNLPVINYTIGVAVEKQWPISIQILQLVGTDSNSRDKDAIREALVPVAEKLYKDIVASDISSKSKMPDAYNVEFLYEPYDEVTTGVLLTFDIELNPVC